MSVGLLVKNTETGQWEPITKQQFDLLVASSGNIGQLRLTRCDGVRLVQSLLIECWNADQHVAAEAMGGDSAGHSFEPDLTVSASGFVGGYFDLGPDWDQYTRIVISAEVAATSLTLRAYGSRIVNDPHPMRLAQVASTGTSGFGSASVSAAAPAVLQLVPAGRFVLVTLHNASSSASAGFLMKMTAFPN